MTTNFDTLLERAFRGAGVECDVFETPEDFRRMPKSGCPIYKIHGSVTASAGLVDTVSQKLRGLSFPVRARLIDLYHRNHILVVGFSGADLAFGMDYLALSALKSSDKGLTWIIEPGRTPNPHAKAAIESVNGTRVDATLPKCRRSRRMRHEAVSNARGRYGPIGSRCASQRPHPPMAV